MSYPTVNFLQSSPTAGSQPINETSTTQRHAIGETIKANDVTYGAGTFIYLPGVASTAKGDLVCYDSKSGATVRAVHGGTGSSGPAAVAMSANVASQFGWYQIAGSTPVNAATVLANTSAYLTSTAGQIDDAIVGGDLIDGLKIKGATSAGFATCQLANPSIAGDTASGTNSGDITVAAIGSSANANGMTLTGQALNLEPASTSFGGIVTTGTQSMAGSKTWTGTATFSGVVNNSGSQATSTASGTGISNILNGKLTRGVTVQQIVSTAWVAAATSQTITLATIPARTRLVAFYADTTVAYAGLSDTIAIKVGSSSGGAEILASHDVKTGVVTKGTADADLGTSMVRSAVIQGALVGSWSAPWSIYVTLTSGTGNLGDGASTTNLTFGTTRYYMIFENL